MIRLFKLTFVLGCFTIFSLGCSEPKRVNAISAEKIAAIEIISFPTQIDKACRNGRAKIFDECADQMDLFETAHARAKADGKSLLVSFGAEWCIWCHVFDSYINGYVDKFTYTFGEEGNDARDTHTMRERAKHDVSQEAYDLKKYVSDNFVLVHIDYEHSSKGSDVIDRAEAWGNFDDFIPYVFSVDSDGIYTASFNHDDAEVRRDTADWYRGYNRVALLGQLKAMRHASIKSED